MPSRTGAHRRVDAGTQWFPGATLNYAEKGPTPGPGKRDDGLAVIFRREDGVRDQLSWDRCASGWPRRVRPGVAECAPGDRVVGLRRLTGHPGGVARHRQLWCDLVIVLPDFGTRAIADRFIQLDPTC